jgi:hypothetical protein
VVVSAVVVSAVVVSAVVVSAVVVSARSSMATAWANATVAGKPNMSKAATITTRPNLDVAESGKNLV